jgi:hypothetical protein
MTSQAVPQDESSAEEQMKRLRLRKVYIQLRIPRVKAEIAALATRKKALNGTGEAKKEVVEELIYSNQHLIALRKELESLEQERKAVLQDLKEVRLYETGKPASTRTDATAPA